MDNKCKDCKHPIGEEYRSGKRFYYCSIQRSNRTENGLKKIKLKDTACEHFNTDLFRKING